MIRLSLPWPPSVNHYWRANGHRRFISKAGQAFREQVINTVIDECHQKTQGRLVVFIALFPPNKRRIDIDNRTKALLDALEHAGVYDNDEQIDALSVRRDVIVKGGKCEVLICAAASEMASYCKGEAA